MIGKRDDLFKQPTHEDEQRRRRAPWNFCAVCGKELSLTERAQPPNVGLCDDHARAYSSR